MARARVQIAGVSSLEEARAAVSAGADALGFTLRLPDGVHDGLTEERARAIVAGLPPFVASVVITYENDARRAAELCRFVGASTLQLHGEFPAREVPWLRAALPHIKIIRALHVTGPECLEAAVAAQRKVDALILDTFDAATGKRGATGKTHDWQLSRQVVEHAGVPVILAGGLTPDNVADAIRRVRPWGVDVHTGVEDGDGARNFSKIRSFVRNASRVEIEPAQRAQSRRRGPKKWGTGR